MIIIGERINGAIPFAKKAIEQRDEAKIRQLATAQSEAGAHFIDCAPSTTPELEYDVMVWLINQIQEVTDTPICIDSPDANLLARIVDEGHATHPGMVNSVSMEGDKCDIIFPLIKNTAWNVVALTCDNDGIPADTDKKMNIAKSIIEKADKYGVELANIHIDPCVMALATTPSSMKDFEQAIIGIHDFALDVKVTGAISNISYDMPARRFINAGCMAYAIRAGLDSAIIDPCNNDIMSAIYASEALCMIDKHGRKYNRAYRQGKIGAKV